MAYRAASSGSQEIIAKLRKMIYYEMFHKKNRKAVLF